MCKHVILMQRNSTDEAMQKKVCKPLLVSRAWLAVRRAISLHHSPDHQFGCFQWQSGYQPPATYLVYRWVLFVWVVATAVASFACQRLPPNYQGPVKKLNYFKWFIYLTNWGYMMIAIQCGLALLCVHKVRTEKNGNMASQQELGVHHARTPLLCRLYWVAHTVATDLALVISLVYWALLHDPKIHELNTLNVIVHGGNSLIMLVELAVTSHPVRVAHALYGAAAGCVYGVFSALYWALGGTDRLGVPQIYPSLDWSQPGTALGFVALCACVLVMCHTVASLLCLLRIRLAKKLFSSKIKNQRLPVQ